jgi:hypothetical protein
VNDATFDALSARTAASLTRRASLIGIGVAAAATLAAPAAAKNKNNRKGRNKKAKDLCGPQEAQCVDAVRTACARLQFPGICLGRFLDCCTPFADCNAERATACFFFGPIP